MGRIKSLMVKRAAKQLLDEKVFNTDFENNKKVLKDTMPSKPVKNKIAGYIARLLKFRAQKQAEEQPKQAAEQPKQAAEQPKQAAEQPKQAAEQPKQAAEQPKQE